jgi:hypothetical protein
MGGTDASVSRGRDIGQQGRRGVSETVASPARLPSCHPPLRWAVFDSPRPSRPAQRLASAREDDGRSAYGPSRSRLDRSEDASPDAPVPPFDLRCRRWVVIEIERREGTTNQTWGPCWAGGWKEVSVGSSGRLSGRLRVMVRGQRAKGRRPAGSRGRPVKGGARGRAASEPEPEPASDRPRPAGSARGPGQPVSEQVQPESRQDA